TLLRAARPREPTPGAALHPAFRGGETLIPPSLPSPYPLLTPATDLSDVEVEVELIRVRAQAHLIQLPLALVGDPGLDHVRGKDVAAEQELVVRLQRVQHLAEA